MEPCKAKMPNYIARSIEVMSFYLEGLHIKIKVELFILELLCHSENPLSWFNFSRQGLEF